MTKGAKHATASYVYVKSSISRSRARYLAFLGLFFFAQSNPSIACLKYRSDSAIVDSLPNGLSYIIVKADPQGREPLATPEASVAMHVLVGTDDQTDTEREYAHLLEHVLVRTSGEGANTSTYLANLFPSAAISARPGAYTSRTETAYQFSGVRAQDLDTVLGVLRDWAEPRELAEQEVQLAKDRIWGEYRQGGDSRLIQRLAEIDGEKHALSVHDVERHLRSVRVEELSKFYSNWYTPYREVVIVSGAISLAEVERKITEKFSDIRGSRSIEKTPSASPISYRPSLMPKKIIIKDDRAPLNKIIYRLEGGFGTPSNTYPILTSIIKRRLAKYIDGLNIPLNQIKVRSYPISNPTQQGFEIEISAQGSRIYYLADLIGRFASEFQSQSIGEPEFRQSLIQLSEEEAAGADISHDFLRRIQVSKGRADPTGKARGSGFPSLSEFQAFVVGAWKPDKFRLVAYGDYIDLAQIERSLMPVNTVDCTEQSVCVLDNGILVRWAPLTPESGGFEFELSSGFGRTYSTKKFTAAYRQAGDLLRIEDALLSDMAGLSDFSAARELGPGNSSIFVNGPLRDAPRGFRYLRYLWDAPKISQETFAREREQRATKIADSATMALHVADELAQDYLRTGYRTVSLFGSRNIEKKEVQAVWNEAFRAKDQLVLTIKGNVDRKWAIRVANDAIGQTKLNPPPHDRIDRFATFKDKIVFGSNGSSQLAAVLIGPSKIDCPSHRPAIGRFNSVIGQRIHFRLVEMESRSYMVSSAAGCVLGTNLAYFKVALSPKAGDEQKALQIAFGEMRKALYPDISEQSTGTDSESFTEGLRVLSRASLGKGDLLPLREIFGQIKISNGYVVTLRGRQ